MSRSIAATLASDEFLSSIIVSPSSFWPRFEHAPDVSPLISIVVRDSDNQWHETLQDRLNRPIDCTGDRCGPLCEAIIHAGDLQHEIIFRIHHSICDGRGLLILVDRILGHYERRSMALTTNRLQSSDLVMRFALKCRCVEDCGLRCSGSRAICWACFDETRPRCPSKSQSIGQPPA